MTDMTPQAHTAYSVALYLALTALTMWLSRRQRATAAVQSGSNKG